jgi:hypothetical protein
MKNYYAVRKWEGGNILITSVDARILDVLIKTEHEYFDNYSITIVY